MNYTEAAKKRIAIFDEILLAGIITSQVREDLYSIFLRQAQNKAMKGLDLTKDWDCIFDDMRSVVGFHFNHSEYVWGKFYEIALKNKHLLFPSVDEFNIALNAKYDGPDEEVEAFTEDEKQQMMSNEYDMQVKLKELDEEESDFIFEERKSYDGRPLMELKITDLFSFCLDDTGLPEFDKLGLIKFKNPKIKLKEDLQNREQSKKVSKMIFDWCVDEKKLSWIDLAEIMPSFQTAKKRIKQNIYSLLVNYWLNTHNVEEFIKLMKMKRFKNEHISGYSFGGRIIGVTVKTKPYEPVKGRIGDIVYFLGKRMTMETVEENGKEVVRPVVKDVYISDSETEFLCNYISAKSKAVKRVIAYYKEKTTDEVVKKLLENL